MLMLNLRTICLVALGIAPVLAVLPDRLEACEPSETGPFRLYATAQSRGRSQLCFSSSASNRRQQGLFISSAKLRDDQITGSEFPALDATVVRLLRNSIDVALKRDGTDWSPHVQTLIKQEHVKGHFIQGRSPLCGP